MSRPSSVLSRSAPSALALSLLLVAGAAWLAPAAAELPPFTPDATVARSAIPDVYKWNLAPLFASDAACDQARGKVLGEIPKLKTYEGKLADPKSLFACLDLYFKLHKDAYACVLYANLRQTTAQSSDAAGALAQQTQGALSDVMMGAGFIRSELLALPGATLAKALKDEPRLAPYRAYIDGLRRRASRQLSPDAERALALLGDNLWAEIDLNELPSPLEDCHGAILTDIAWPKVKDDQGREVQLTLSNYQVLRRSPNREARKAVVQAFLGTLRQYQHALAATLAGQFDLDVAYARARHYDTALEAYTDKDDVSMAAFENLVKTVNANLPLLHRYVALRKQVLGLPEVHLYDLYIPLVSGVDMDIPFPRAQRSILDALAPLGPQYGKMLAEGLDPRNGWLDLYPHLDKDSGASSSSIYGVHPFIKMNYQNSLDDMGTLAHEYGHALHSDLAMKAQSYPDSRYPIFLAEIASTCNEALLNDYLVAHAATDAEKAYLLVGRLEDIRTTIFRQTMFAEFERIVHGYVESGTPVTATLLEAAYRELVQRYYGPDYTLDENDGLEWSYVPHFYYKYYVYQYATGLASGIAIADRVSRMGAPAVDAYLAMLKGGCAEPPLTLLQKAGVDLTKPDAIAASMQAFERTLNEAQKLIVKK